MNDSNEIKLKFLLIKAIDYLCKLNQRDHCSLVEIYHLIYPENQFDLVRLNFLRDQMKTLHSFGILEDQSNSLTSYSLECFFVAIVSSSGVVVLDLAEIIDSDIDDLMKKYGKSLVCG